MLFRRVEKKDLPYIYSWLDSNDYLRQEVLESAFSRGILYGVEVDGRVEAVSILYPVDIVVWSKDSEDLLKRISPIARWIWRSYIYYKDLR